jgi:hydroxymethylpyrimidine pyrophosphatase-like HAD family hydrolase
MLSKIAKRICQKGYNLTTHNSRMLIADINVFLDKDGSFCKRKAYILDALRKHGILIVLKTSHSENIAKHIAKGLNTDVLIICGGAYAKKDDQLLHSATISNVMANEIISLLIHSDELIDLTVDSVDSFFSMRPSTITEINQGYSNTLVTDFNQPLEPQELLKITARLSNSRIAYKIAKLYPSIYLTEFKSENGYQFKLILSIVFALFFKNIFIFFSRNKKN